MGRLKVPLLGLLGLLDLVLCVLFVVALLDTRRLPVQIEHGGDTCPWVLPGSPLSGDSPTCVLSIAGVALRDVSLVRDPGYLASDQEFQAWLQDQGALHQALRESAEIPLHVLQNGKPDSIQVPVLSVGPGDLGLGIVPMAFTTLGTLLIGLFVFWRRPEKPQARALFVCSQAIFLTILTTAFFSYRGLALPAWEATLIYYLNILGNIVAATSLTWLLAIFPQRRFGRYTNTVALLLPATLGFLVFVAELLGLFGALMLFIVPIALSSLALVAWTSFRPGSPIQRLESRWVIWGFVVPILTWMVTRLPLVMGLERNRDPSDVLIGIAMITIPIGLAIAILRYRLLDIEVVIRRTILGAMVTSVVLFTYNLGISSFASGLADSGSPNPVFSSVFISAIVLTFLLLPAQARLEETLDRLFFRNRHSYRQVLARIPDELQALVTPDQAAELVLEQVSRSMETTRALVLLCSTSGLDRAWERPSASPDRPETTLPNDPSFRQALDALREPHLCDAGSGTRIDAWLVAEGFDLVLPLRTSESLVGLMATSLPRGTLTFAAEDLVILRSVAASLAMSLSRALAYETIRRMNEQLEERIRVRTSELEQTRVQLYQWEKMASLGALAAGVAHELNTPLGVVLSTADQLTSRLQQDSASNPRMARLASLCLEAARRASSIVQDLRTFSRPESQNVELLDLHSLIESTVRLLGPKLRQQNIQIHLERGDIPNVPGFGAILSQTFANLLINAVAAVGHDGEIRVLTERRGLDKVAVIVSDTGPGIPQELRSRIFDPFFTTKPPGEGTGLGLSLCYAFISRHGGRIWEEGAPGEGARFVVELPIKASPSLDRPSEILITGAVELPGPEDR